MPKQLIIIDIRGGTVQDVTSNLPPDTDNLDIVVRDWDDIAEGAEVPKQLDGSPLPETLEYSLL